MISVEDFVAAKGWVCPHCESDSDLDFVTRLEDGSRKMRCLNCGNGFVEIVETTGYGYHIGHNYVEVIHNSRPRKVHLVNITIYGVEILATRDKENEAQLEPLVNQFLMKGKSSLSFIEVDENGEIECRPT